MNYYKNCYMVTMIPQEQSCSLRLLQDNGASLSSVFEEHGEPLACLIEFLIFRADQYSYPLVAFGARKLMQDKGSHIPALRGSDQREDCSCTRIFVPFSPPLPVKCESYVTELLLLLPMYL